MVKLVERNAVSLETVTIGEVTLSGVTEGQVTSLAPFKGQDAAVSASLVTALGIGMPEPNQHLEASGIRALWAGRGRMLLIGAAPPDLKNIAAITDQTGAEAVMQIAGDTAEDVLARLIPLDLRQDSFGAGATARTMLGHMQATVSRMGPDRFELRVMRSMAGTMIHEVSEAARLFAAR